MLPWFCSYADMGRRCTVYKKESNNNLHKAEGSGLQEVKDTVLQDTDETDARSLFPEAFRIALDSTIQPIYIIDPENLKMLYCNETIRNYLGDNLVGLTCHKAIRGIDEPCPDCVALKLYRYGINETTEYLTPQGRWMLARVSPFQWKGKELYKVACFDITDRKHLEAELRLRSKEYEALMRQSMTGVMRYDIIADKAEINVDRNLDRVPEYTIPNYTEVVSKSGMVAAGSIDTVKKILDDVQQGKPDGKYDIQLSLKRDGLRWIHTKYVLVEDEEGKPYKAMVSFYDNTEEKEKELAYQSWSASMTSFLNEHSVYMEVNLSLDLIEIESRPGSQMKHLSGRGYTEVVKSVENETIFHQDRSSFGVFFNRERLLGQFFEGKDECSHEYRVMADGEPRWYQAEVRMVRDPHSKNVKASITLNNVDEAFREKARLKGEAERDSMTGLYNHATTERLIRGIMAQDTEEVCSFLVIDLDDLRAINSDLGHPEGDRALRDIAECMRAVFSEGSILGRMGGDEFVALLREISNEDKLREIISEFMARLSKARIGVLNNRSVCVSIGVAIGKAGCDDFTTLYRQADLALYYTKAMGKNDFNMYTPELEKREFTYRPRSTATLTKNNCYEDAEIGRLLNAVSSYFPLVISANLTKNTYYMMEYESFTTQKARENGDFDQLIIDGAITFHPNDKDSFFNSLNREKLICDYNEGIRMVEHTGLQLGDDGIYRTAHTIAVLSEDEKTGDICYVAFTHISSSDSE